MPANCAISCSGAMWSCGIATGAACSMAPGCSLPHTRHRQHSVGTAHCCRPSLRGARVASSMRHTLSHARCHWWRASSRSWAGGATPMRHTLTHAACMGGQAHHSWAGGSPPVRHTLVQAPWRQRRVGCYCRVAQCWGAAITAPVRNTLSHARQRQGGGRGATLQGRGRGATLRRPPTEHVRAGCSPPTRGSLANTGWGRCL